MKRTRKIVRFLAMILVVSLTFSNSMSAMAATSSSKVKSVKVTNLPANTLTLKKGKSLNLKVKVTGTGKNVSQKVTYKSNKTKVATVSSKGKVIAKKNGTAKITVTSKADKTKKTVITVTVGTPVTSVKLNKTSEQILPKKTTTLKATIAPTKASNKKVVWTSSNEKVATVSSRGVVKGVAAGTARITATAADGSGKKATAKITVKNPISLNSVSVVNASTVSVSLSDAQALSASDFTVKLNATGKGSYNKVCTVDNIVTSDNKTYLIVLDSDDYIKDQENVQVVIKNLWGNNNASKTTTYSEGVFKYTSTTSYSVRYNESVSKNFSLSGSGYSACTVTGLPSGIKMKCDGTSVQFYGKPTQKGKVVSTLVSADELGNTYTYSITWLIGSSDSISATATPVYVTLSPSGTASVSRQVSVNGGSGSYTYSLIGTTYGLSIDSSGTISGTLLSAGTYTLNVSVQDSQNAAYKTTTPVVINVAATVAISGIVKDLSGNPIPDAEIECANKDKANKYGTYFNTFSDSNGAFSLSLVPGIYDISAYSHGSHRYLYSQSLTVTRSGFDITLPVRRVVIYSNNAAVDASDFGTWYDEEGTSYGSGNVVWLKEGKYQLTATTTSGRSTVTANLNVNVTAATTNATATVTVTSVTPVGTLVNGSVVSANITGDYSYYTFTPSTSGTYYFYSQGSVDTCGCLENVSGRQLTSDDDGGESNNFYFSYNCTAGVTYYVGVRKYSGGTSTTTLCVTSTRPSFDSYDEDDDY